MRPSRLVLLPVLTLLPFGLAGLIGARHVPSTLPPCIEATASTVDFARSEVDGLWLRQIEVSNCGDGPIAVDRIDLAGGEGAFTLLGQPPAGLVSVERPLTLTIGFTPDEVGRYRGALQIAAVGARPVEVGLVGEGVAAASDCAPPTVLPGGFVTRTGQSCPETGAPVRLSPVEWLDDASARQRRGGLAPSREPPPTI